MNQFQMSEDQAHSLCDLKIGKIQSNFDNQNLIKVWPSSQIVYMEKKFFEFLKDKSNDIYENSITESGMISASYIEQAIQR